MFQKVLLIQLLLLHSATQSQPETSARCHEDAQMMCPVPNIESLDFFSITWHKLSETKKRLAVIKWKDNVTTLFKNMNRSLEQRFGEKYSLLMPRVTPEDQGTYECEITANLGGRNQNFLVQLTVQECSIHPETTTMTPESNVTQSIPLYSEEDVPAWCSGVGYVAVGLTKIALSLISVWVIEAVGKRSSR
ncbi:uncharacterized protein LOC119222561 [Pungitius pungitius]|uniref:uncharacterized protein LOC119222561 n=1 Tax=Pungitius pungitius TaxID=134920 RepID=UPI002E15FD68